jgi:hypothetical protein
MHVDWESTVGQAQEGKTMEARGIPGMGVGLGMGVGPGMVMGSWHGNGALGVGRGACNFCGHVRGAIILIVLE